MEEKDAFQSLVFPLSWIYTDFLVFMGFLQKLKKKKNQS